MAKLIVVRPADKGRSSNWSVGWGLTTHLIKELARYTEPRGGCCERGNGQDDLGRAGRSGESVHPPQRKGKVCVACNRVIGLPAIVTALRGQCYYNRISLGTVYFHESTY